MMFVGATRRVCAVALGLVLVLPLGGCVSTVVGIAVRDSHAVPTDVPPLKASDLQRVLLSIDDVNKVLGTKDLEVTSELDDMTDSSDKVTDTDCLGAMFGAEKIVYDGSGWTAVHDWVAREPEEDNDHWVEQTAVLYPDADHAKKFFERSEATWRKCAGTSLAVDDSSSSSLWEIGDLTSDDGLLTQMAMQQDADGWGCQHALSAVSNMTVETWACAYRLSDEAATMATDIVSNAAK